MYVYEILISLQKSFINIINNLIDWIQNEHIFVMYRNTLLISQDDVKIPLFDTTRIHAESAVKYSIEEVV